MTGVQTCALPISSSVIKTYVVFPNEKIDKAPDYSSLLNSLQTDEGTSIALIILVMIIAGGVLMVIVALFS